MLEFGKGLDVGVKRKGKKNQDALRIVGIRTKTPLMIVADGMGGFNGGREASRIVIQTLTHHFHFRRRRKSLAEMLHRAILASHRAIIKRSKTSDGLAKMGSTVACAVIDEANEQITIANVGDSRVYLIGLEQIKVVSHDHSEVAELERKGVLNPVEAQNYVRKNILTMSLAAHRPQETVKPFITQVPFPPGSVLLLCSDGLWGTVPDHLIRLTALECAPQKAAQKLVDFANTGGGPDNISVLIARRKGEWRKYQKEFSVDKEDTQN
jgi:protein phosphatase